MIKRTASESSVNRRQLHSIMYPIEQFVANLQDDIDFYPNDGENVYYRLNPALAAGTSYFNSVFIGQGNVFALKTHRVVHCTILKTQETGLYTKLIAIRSSRHKSISVSCDICYHLCRRSAYSSSNYLDFVVIL